MHKEIIVVLVIISSIFLFDWYLQDYTKKSTTEINNQLEEMKQKLKDKEKGKIEEILKNIKNNWSKKYGILAIFIEHEELEKVEKDFISLEGYIEIDDYDNGINEVNQSIFSLKHIDTKYDFSLVNVF